MQQLLLRDCWPLGPKRAADTNRRDGVDAPNMKRRRLPKASQVEKSIVLKQPNKLITVSESVPTTSTIPEMESTPSRPESRDDFRIAVFSALTLEANAVKALFDNPGDDSGRYGKAPGDFNTYTIGVLGGRNIVLVHLPRAGKSAAATAAANCRASFPNIKRALVVGICGVVSTDMEGLEIVLGDVIISDNVIEHDLGRQIPGEFVRKNTLAESLPRSSAEISSFLAKLKCDEDKQKLLRDMNMYLNLPRSKLNPLVPYPGVHNDRLFDASYPCSNQGKPRDNCGCPDSKLVPRVRLRQPPQPEVHFGLVASGDTVMKSEVDRDRIAQKEDAIAFEMESAGIWEQFPSVVVIKGACDYADSHKTKLWQPYAAATAAACLKAFLRAWTPSMPSEPGMQ
ncbi:hypothetical protein NPX13_g4106 [Xylaria arbuscula]|uniref:Nucleoside phosphorylase domain-containing protein n=1 Tax=Xylaria arbuscula TaxID=114810 RepID=A0A9W8TPG2_9PEZI|nr:hypothetical protein NPX13_g4106 [Xylaria arbuscula]